MRHNIALYDTGRISSYTRRNEGWAFASMLIGGMGTLFVGPGAYFAFIDGYMVGSLLLAIVQALFILNIVMFTTHRNFMLSEAGTDANDALYLLPAQERKRWKVDRAELHTITQHEANQLVEAVRTYRSNTPAAAGGISKLTQALNDVNNEYKMIEGKQ